MGRPVTGSGVVRGTLTAWPSTLTVISSTGGGLAFGSVVNGFDIRVEGAVQSSSGAGRDFQVLGRSGAWGCGLPGFVSLEADDTLQTTALQIEDGRITAIYVVRNPDKLQHVAEGLPH